MDLINSMSAWQWSMAIGGAMMIGMGKSGIKGLGPMIVTSMVLAFGGRASTGLMMPLLILGDIFAVSYYNRFARWELLRKVMPWMLGGVLIGSWLGPMLSEEAFQKFMSAIILLSTILMLLSDLRRSKVAPSHPAFAAVMGLFAGFTSMVGNLAGAFTNLYFLSMQLNKQDFIGSAAWLYLVINLCKLPLHLFLWQTLRWETLPISLGLMVPVVAGLLIGLRLVRYIKDHAYRRFVIFTTAIGAIVIFFR